MFLRATQFSPLSPDAPYSVHPARGYAARRGSQAGSVLAVREGREPSPEGPAENGLPPATRGKRQGIGPTLSFHAANGAPDVPVRHARRLGLADASASSAGMAAVRKGQTPFRPQCPQGEVLRDEKSERPIPETGGRHPPAPAFAEGSGSQAKTAERGAERCHIHSLLRGSFQRPVRCSLKPHGRRFRRVDVGIGRARRTGQPSS
ncbi:hypothetical protein BSY16_2946 [Sinorhizobium sp. RAC02]|nr:hypothetical protein BSY16_2946 [Sinorhizobium sp. RAC02]